MKRRQAFAAVAAAACLLSCSSKKDYLPPPPPLDASGPYRLQSGDRVSVKFYNNPELDETVTVRPDGFITVQMAGDVPAAGRTPAELGKMLERRFTGELAKPRVAVIVRGLGGNRVFVGGQVKEPRAVRLRDGLTAFQAIQEAGGLDDTAGDEIVLIRRDADGQPRAYVVDIEPVRKGIDPSQDVPLAAADIVHVTRSGIADANLVVEQYIRNMLPIQPGFAIPIP